jgi:hypothetical protein
LLEHTLRRHVVRLDERLDTLEPASVKAHRVARATARGCGGPG